MKEITNEYLNSIQEHFEENYRAGFKINEYLLHSSVTYRDVYVYTLGIPKVFNQAEIACFHSIVETAYRIFGKVIRAYLNDPSYRALYPFSKELEELILVPNLYDSLLPIARFDIFYNEETGDFKFCEINTDGTSSMNEDYILNKAIALNPAHQEMLKKHTFKTFELFDSWVDCFMQLYSTYKKKTEHPHVAIVDFLAGGSITEFQEFQERFQKKGISCEICEIKELSYENGSLISPSGKQIDVIYRRAVTTDVMAHYDEVLPFIQAVKDQNVCIMGSFCTQIIHNKWLFKMLHEKETLALLTDKEIEFVKKHVPYTNLLDSSCCDPEEVIADKDRWLIKPLDSYASRGVYAGCDCTQEEWRAHILEYLGKGYIYQEYCSPYRSMNISYEDEPVEYKEYTNMTGLFVYNGTFAGVYSRLSDGGIISSQYNEKDVPTLILED